MYTYFVIVNMIDKHICYSIIKGTLMKAFISVPYMFWEQFFADWMGGREMSTLAELCERESSLSRVQIEFLRELSASLPFVADLAHANLRLYVSAMKEGVVLAEEIRPNTVLSETELHFPEEAALVEETFRSGKPIAKKWEGDTEVTAGVWVYAVTDFGGAVIAVVSLSFRSVFPMEEYAQLLHAAGMVLKCGRKLQPDIYGRLAPEDGILIADRFHRIVFADDMVLHIYRILGVGSLVGRQLLDSRLGRAIDREIITKERPWERELETGKRILRERRMDFTSGGNAMGHIVILSDITELRQREQEARIQEALIRRIEELEEEMEQLKDSLETRKLMDRAKGILMTAHGLTEMESYRRIQRYAMTKRMTIKEVAEAILKAANK